MAEPYTIRIFVLNGDPEGTKIVELLNWTGVGITFPRAAWPGIKSRDEFRRSGVYILTGTAEGTADDLPTIYVGQGDEIGARIDAHFVNKDFWDWGYAFVSNGNALNRAHITWLEYKLVALATLAGRSHLDNGNQPKEPKLSEYDKADIHGFLREMLRILPLLGVRVFEKPEPVAVPAASIPTVVSLSSSPLIPLDMCDTVVVPAQDETFRNIFLGEKCWRAIRISGGMLSRIKYIAAYQTAPVSAVTHVAPVERIEPYGDGGKYRLVFTEPAQPLPRPIPFADSPRGLMQGPRYTNLVRLQTASRVADLFSQR